jgi:alpha-beta hydrolase superfamily lysophospholipase
MTHSGAAFNHPYPAGMADWQPDILGEGYEQQVFDLGEDPDGEGHAVATLVRRIGPEDPERAVVYVHGFTDYFFHTELADFFAERGFAFFALDLRRCGRSRRPGQTPHYVSDLEQYDDAELSHALAAVRHETGDAPVLLAGHSTGGLVLSLWLDRLNAGQGGARGAGISGLVLNSPFLDLQGKPWMRSWGTQLFRVMAKIRPFGVIKLPPGNGYGSSLHVSEHGEWVYDLEWKPIGGFPITYGWINAIRRGHARLHKGLDVGVPSLVLRSAHSRSAPVWTPEVDELDGVLDTRQIARWAGCLGDEVTAVPIVGARHDVFLSKDGARDEAYRVLDRWLHDHHLVSA